MNDPRYAGPILINPGGPGGPGAAFAVMVGGALQDIVDSDIYPARSGDDARYYDIIGFDPRGIGETEPTAACMPDVTLYWSWNLRQNEEGIFGSSDAALSRHWSMTHAWGASCKRTMEAHEGPSILRYMTTAFVARDMLEIVEKHASYVADQLVQFTPNTRPYWPCHKPDPALSRPSEAKLNYWGFSYGTFLGSTFASMFPDRVGRMILDGVVSSYDYTHSLGGGSLVDGPKAMESFNTYCLLSGPEACPLATRNSTLDDIRDRVEAIVQSLFHNPFPISSASGPEVLTYSDVKALLFTAIYQPRAFFPFIAKILSAIETKDDKFLEDMFAPRSTHSATQSTAINLNPLDATFAVLCGDGLDQTAENITSFASYWHTLETTSPVSGAIWAAFRMRCASWTIVPSFKFDGPFGAPTPNSPILFISNTADPVTPLRSGRYMHSLFPNSELLILDTAGHCSITSPSYCALSHVRSYFQTGTLPPPNTLCVPPVDVFSLNSTDPDSPFYDPDLAGGNVVPAIEEEEEMMYVRKVYELLENGNVLQRAVAESEMWGFRGVVGGRMGARMGVVERGPE